MEQKNEIMDELQQIGPLLAGAGRVHPFAVPSGYFESLPASITGYVIDETRVPASDTPYTVPGSYFDKLAVSIVTRVALAQTEVEEELAAVAPLLRSIHKKEVYTAPQGYFDVPRSIPEADKNAAARVIGLNRYKRLIQYAVAAMLGGLLVTGAFMFTDSKDYIRAAKTAAPVSGQENVPGSNANPLDESASVTTEEVVPGKQSTATVQKMPFSKKIELLSDDELQNYLEENAPSEPIQLVEDTSEDTTI